MADVTPAKPLAPDPADSPESATQYKAALAIVAGLIAIAAGLIVAGLISGQWAILTAPVGVIIGGLVNALNAPSGISKVIGAAKQVPQGGPTDPQ